MKIDRLLAIVIILLNKKKVTAHELAESFEVTERTIYRDIDTLDRAGIPIITYQGAGGGIGLIDGFIMDRQLVKQPELESIITALKGLSSIIDDDDYVKARQKVESLLPAEIRSEVDARRQRVTIDFSPFGSDASYRETFRTLKHAMDENRLVRIRYGSSSGEITFREIEPYSLHFKGNAWYLLAYCRMRDDLRFFKVNRMSDLEELPKIFAPRESAIAEYHAESGPHDPRKLVTITMSFKENARARAEELFGRPYLVEDDGRFYTSVTWPLDGWVYGVILSFGSDVTVLEPDYVADEVMSRAKQLLENYKKNSRT